MTISPVTSSRAGMRSRVRPRSASAHTNRRPVASSTAGYRQEIGSLHFRQRARSKTKERSGMLSYQAMGVAQRGHADRGLTMLRPAGTRAMTTLRKLPTQSPTKKITGAAAMRGVTEAPPPAPPAGARRRRDQPARRARAPAGRAAE